MARKSRKNMMPQAAVQEAVQQNEKELLRTAAYARLSVENGGHETEDSLHTQILQIHNYIRENPELTLTDTYADNGFTGTRFDRPEFERMMQDVRTGKIQCIVVKDLSRFGRDYIETGSYLETIFPMQKKQSITVRCVDIEDLEKQAEAIRVEQIKLYESYADGVLLRDAYIEKKKALSEKLAALQDSIRIEKEEQECADELDEEIRALTKQASEKTYIGGLTKECVDAFVSMVYLYDDQTMKIEFNCEDVIRRALEKYGA